MQEKTLDKWKDQQMNDQVFRLRQSKERDAIWLLRSSMVNAVRTVPGAQCELVGSLHREHLGLPATEFYLRYREIQLSVGVPKNGREQYLAALKAQAIIDKGEKEKGLFGRIFGGGSDDGE